MARAKSQKMTKTHGPLEGSYKIAKCPGAARKRFKENETPEVPHAESKSFCPQGSWKAQQASQG